MVPARDAQITSEKHRIENVKTNAQVTPQDKSFRKTAPVNFAQHFRNLKEVQRNADSINASLDIVLRKRVAVKNVKTTRRLSWTPRNARNQFVD